MWAYTQKTNTLTGPRQGDELKYIYSSEVGQGDPDLTTRGSTEKFSVTSRNDYRGITARTTTDRGEYQTAFGFPTIH